MAFETIKCVIPESYKRYVSDIVLLGRKTYKITLKAGWCFNDDGVHQALINRYSLFKSFDEISMCSCDDCILSGALRNRIVFGKKI